MSPTGHHAASRRRVPRRAWLAGIAAVLLLALGWAGWQGYRGARDLQAAAAQLAAVRGELAEGESALDDLRRAGELTSDAASRLSDPLLRVVATVPVVGEPVATAAALAEAADTSVRRALLPLVTWAGPQPAQRLTSGAGAFDVDYLAQLAEPADAAVAALGRAALQLAGASPDPWLAPVARAYGDFSTDLARLRSALSDVALGLEVAPELLGQDGTRRYLLVSQSPAEARGTGGLIGGYSLLEVNDGRLSIVRSGPRSDLTSPGKPVVDLGPQFHDHYGHNGAASGWINSNLSPHFPYAAQIWHALWERQYGEQLDGALVIDPIALSYVLRATGPIALPDGTQVTAENVADLTMRDVYARFPGLDDDPLRDAYLQQISTGVAAALTTQEVPGRPLVEALAEAVAERRLLFWSANEQVQEQLADQPVSGHIAEGVRAVGDVVVDAAGSKLGYYLERDLRYTAGCGESSELALTLTNAAPASGLPPYVTPGGSGRATQQGRTSCWPTSTCRRPALSGA